MKKLLEVFNIKNLNPYRRGEIDNNAIKLNDLNIFISEHISKQNPMQFSNYVLRSKEDFHQFMQAVDTFILDCDGVIYEGQNMLPNSLNTIKYLRENNKRLFFLTNSSTYNRKKCAERLNAKGVDVDISEVYCASYLSAQFFKTFLSHISKVYVVGNNQLKEEFEQVGITAYGGDEDSQKYMDTEHFSKLKSDDDVLAVVVGEDDRFNSYKLNMASFYLQHKNCILFTANIDNYDNINKRNYSSAGALTSAIEATANKKSSYTAGKPSPFMFYSVLQKHKDIIKDRTCMIGDRLDTDIAFAKNCGLISTLVLSGVSKPDYFQTEAYHKHNLRPNYVMSHLGQIYETLVQKK